MTNEKWSVLEPSVVQNKLNTWPKDYTSIVVTKNDTEKEIIYVSSFGYGLFQFIDREPSAVYNKTNSPLETHMAMRAFIVV